MIETSRREIGAAPGDCGPLPPHDLLLGQRLRVHAAARFVVAGAIVLGALAGRGLAGMAGLDAGALALVAGGIAAYNLGVLRLIGDARDPAEASRLLRTRRHLLHASIILDYSALTVCLWFVGGVRSPFVALYLFHIMIASILLSRRAALASALLASLLLVGLGVLELSGTLPPRFPAGSVPGGGELDRRYATTVVIIYSALFALAAMSQTALAEVLRRAERVTMRKAGELEKLSAARRDFLHVAIHDLNSPIGVATMLLANLQQGLCGPLTPAQADQVDRALQRLVRLQGLLRELRLMGELESGGLQEHSVAVDMARLVSEATADHRDSARERDLSLSLEPADSRPTVIGVPRLLREAVANYLTNAVKYTPRGGAIVVRLRASAGSARVEVADSGPGISREDQARLFREFVRLESGNGPTPGSGLGLSIVRRIVEAHGGRVGVTSATGEGSTFWFELPLAEGAAAPSAGASAEA